MLAAYTFSSIWTYPILPIQPVPTVSGPQTHGIQTCTLSTWTIGVKQCTSTATTNAAVTTLTTDKSVATAATAKPPTPVTSTTTGTPTTATLTTRTFYDPWHD